MKLSNRFKKMCEIYQFFAALQKGVEYDFSEEAMIEMYRYETYGEVKATGIRCTKNGFFHGKSGLDLHATDWKEDIEKGYLFIEELYNDKSIPNWILDFIFKEKHYKSRVLQLRQLKIIGE